MRLLFVHPSKQFVYGSAYGYDVHRARRDDRLPSSGRMWGADLAATLAARGHDVTYGILETAAFMDGWFGAPRRTIHRAPRLTFVCSADLDDLRPHCVAAEGFVLRNDHPPHAQLFAAAAPERRPVVQIQVSVGRLRFHQTQPRFTLLVNDASEVERYRAAGLNAQIFAKPARALFYAAVAPAAKRYDVLSAMWDTSVARKRFDLLLDALPLLDAAAPRPLRLAVAGDSTSHATRLAGLATALRRVSIEVLGSLSAEALATAYRRARITVVTSREDANPQVITESLACDTPVACAADLTGGLHQITPHTGAVFRPTAADLAATLLAMLDQLDRYAPARYVTRLEDAADQLEGLLGATPPARPKQPV